jgi:ribosomal protein S18 acetylase RimI-like enzyme
MTLGGKTMKLVPTTDGHLRQLMNWFPDQLNCAHWASPEFRYPFTETTFREDIRTELPSYSLVADDGQLLGFGQYYPRAARCHLARLVISPNHRGRSLGAFLIRALCRRGCRKLRLRDCSLFVLADNVPAVRLYKRSGFVMATYPGDTPQIERCVYMVAPLKKILSTAVQPGSPGDNALAALVPYP